MTTAWIVISGVVSVLTLASGIVIILTRKPRPTGGEIVVLREAPVTFIMAVLLIFLSCGVLVMKFMGHPVGGSNVTSYQFCAWFGFVCMLIGVYALFYTFVKKVLAYEDRMIIVNLLGYRKTVYWEDVTHVKTNRLSRQLVFYVGNDGNSLNGDAESYRQFVHLASQRVPPHVGSDTLGNLDFQLNIAKGSLHNKRR